MKSKLTIYDISRLSGVSIATVSRVLNGYPNVNEETRRKVTQVIREQDYVPKQSARNFRDQELYAVGLLMDDIRNPFMAGFAFVISREFSKLKINTILCNIHDVEQEFVEQVDNLVDRKVHGIIMMGSIFENRSCRMLLEGRYSGIPFVSINGCFGLRNVCEVILNQQRGMMDAVGYLNSRGRSRIGFVFRNQSRSDKQKLDGFLEGMHSRGLKTDRMQEIREKSIESGKQATAELLSRYPDTDAIIYSSDTLAVGGTHYMNAAGIAIPDQVMVIGFNNSASACDCYPPLTSVDNSINEAGKAAAQKMLQMINHSEVEDILIPCRLVVREST